MPISGIYGAPRERWFVKTLMDQIDLELTCIVALEKNMVDILPIMITEVAMRRIIYSYIVRKTTSRKAFVHQYSKEGLSFIGGIDFPD